MTGNSYFGATEFVFVFGTEANLHYNTKLVTVMVSDGAIPIFVKDSAIQIAV